MQAPLVIKPGQLSVEEVPDPAPRDHEVLVPGGWGVVARELTIVGVNSVRHTFRRAAALLAAGTIPAARPHGPPLPLADTAAAIEATRRGAGLKTRVQVGNP